jgi:hypothetical protein
MKFIIGHIVLSAIVFCLLSHFETPQSSLFANVYFKAFVYEFVSKFMSTYVCFKVMSTNVSQSLCLPMSVSKLLYTSIYVKALVY